MERWAAPAGGGQYRTAHHVWDLAVEDGKLVLYRHDRRRVAQEGGMPDDQALEVGSRAQLARDWAAGGMSLPAGTPVEILATGIRNQAGEYMARVRVDGQAERVLVPLSALALQVQPRRSIWRRQPQVPAAPPSLDHGRRVVVREDTPLRSQEGQDVTIPAGTTLQVVTGRVDGGWVGVRGQVDGRPLQGYVPESALGLGPTRQHRKQQRRDRKLEEARGQRARRMQEHLDEVQQGQVDPSDRMADADPRIAQMWWALSTPLDPDRRRDIQQRLMRSPQFQELVGGSANIRWPSPTAQVRQETHAWAQPDDRTLPPDMEDIPLRPDERLPFTREVAIRALSQAEDGHPRGMGTLERIRQVMDPILDRRGVAEHLRPAVFHHWVESGELLGDPLSEAAQPTPEPEAPTPTPEPQASTPEPQAPTPAPEAPIPAQPTPEPRAPTPAPRAPMPEGKAPTPAPEPGAPTPEAPPDPDRLSVQVGELEMTIPGYKMVDTFKLIDEMGEKKGRSLRNLLPNVAELEAARKYADDVSIGSKPSRETDAGRRRFLTKMNEYLNAIGMPVGNRVDAIYHYMTTTKVPIPDGSGRQGPARSNYSLEAVAQAQVAGKRPAPPSYDGVSNVSIYDFSRHVVTSSEGRRAKQIWEELGWPTRPDRRRYLREIWGDVAAGLGDRRTGILEKHAAEFAQAAADVGVPPDRAEEAFWWWLNTGMLPMPAQTRDAGGNLSDEDILGRQQISEDEARAMADALVDQANDETSIPSGEGLSGPIHLPPTMDTETFSRWYDIVERLHSALRVIEQRRRDSGFAQSTPKGWAFDPDRLPSDLLRTYYRLGGDHGYEQLIRDGDGHPRARTKYIEAMLKSMPWRHSSTPNVVVDRIGPR